MKPVLDALQTRVVQTRMDQYASHFHRAARIRSKRIAKVVLELTKGRAAGDNMLADSAAAACVNSAEEEEWGEGG